MQIMRLPILFTFLFWKFTGMAQPNDQPLRYLTVMSNHRIASLTIIYDTIEISRASNRPEAADTKRYPIIPHLYAISPDKNHLDLRLEGYPVHWYSESVFKTYSTYPGINTADSFTMIRLTADYVQAMIEIANKDHTTRLGDLYGAGTGQDILSKTLIEHHFNPDVTLSELSARIQQLHITIPDIPIYHSAPRRPTLSSDTTHSPAAPRVAAPH